MLAELAGKLHPESGRPRGDGWQVCQEHRQYIADHIADGVCLTKIRKLLRRQRCAQVSYATLWRFAIAELGWGGGEPTVLLADGEPGEEVQLDTGWVGLLCPDLCGRRRRFRAWIFTPVVSRYRFVYPVSRETTQTAIEACEAAWRFYGGVFDVLIPDNTKTKRQGVSSATTATEAPSRGRTELPTPLDPAAKPAKLPVARLMSPTRPIRPSSTSRGLR